ncbi:ImmA/IrrE family metallo-endopeptidase [Streptomyces sp. NPDC101227]|uniref:ImmA/IrrE family metallo-endopeptidase n=1 Tax=Streptomyces sp. NPDC101227 TaxID=3366136 RepID=UPI00380CD4D5
MYASIQQDSERFVRSLNLPAVTGIRDLIPEVERRTGLAVELQPAEVQVSTPCGLWIATEKRHYIFYDPRTSVAHQDHIIAHEIAHILKDHQGTAKMSTDVSGISAELILSVLGRTQYDDAQELEAEMVGTYLQAHVLYHRKDRSGILDESESGRVARTFIRSRKSNP